MLKNSASRNQKLKGVKAKLAFRMFLVLAVGLWMIYHLRLFLSHKLASKNGGLVKGEVIGPEQLKLGRKGLDIVMSDGDRGESNETEKETEEQDEIEQIEYLVDGIEKGGDEDEGPKIEPLDDPSEVNEDDEDDEENVSSIERKTGDDDSSRGLKKDAI